MVPPNSDHNEDHRIVVEELDKLGYDVQTTDSFQADLCGDFQARERWIAIARDIDHHAPIHHNYKDGSKSTNQTTVPVHFDTFYTTHSSPLSAILDPVNQVPRQCWIHENFIRVFNNPTKYADNPVEPVKFPYCGGTSLTIREDAELAMLVERALNEHSITNNKTPLILGTDLNGRSHKVLGNPLVCKIWCIIYNIIQRCNLCSHHDTFVIDTAGDGSGLCTALALRHKVKAKSALSGNLATFSVGQYSGGELATGPTYVKGKASLTETQNIYSQVLALSSNTQAHLLPHDGFMFNICTFQRYPSLKADNFRSSIARQANSLVKGTLHFTNKNLAEFKDPCYLFQSLHITRSCYIGHLQQSKRKGFKVYHPDRSAPTFTGHANILILDERSTKNQTVRLLSFNEICRLNNFSPKLLSFLKEVSARHGSARTYKYIANSIPAGMLHSIYRSAIEWLNRSYVSGGEQAPPPERRVTQIVTNATGPPSSIPICAYITQYLFTDEHECLNMYGGSAHDGVYDIDVTKKRSLHPVPTPRKIRDQTHDAAVARLRVFHRTHHSPNDKTRKILECCSGHRLKKEDYKYTSPLCVDCALTHKDKDYRKHHSPRTTSYEENLQPGEGWSLDGADLGQIAIGTGYRHAINFQDMKSKHRVVYFTKTTNSFEFKQALEWLMQYVHQFTGRYIKFLYSDMFSSYMSFVGEESIAAFRNEYGITLHVIPPYMHHKNHEAEASIHQCTKGTRARLRHLLHQEVRHHPIPNPAAYWPYAWQHSIQSYNMLPNATLEKRWSIICTPWQMFTGVFTKHVMNLHPFGETAFTLIEKKQRDGKLGPVRERCLYLCNGHMNSLQNKFSHMPDSDILLFCNNANIKTSGKVTFPYLSLEETRNNRATTTQVPTQVDPIPPSQRILGTDKLWPHTKSGSFGCHSCQQKPETLSLSLLWRHICHTLERASDNVA